MPEDTNMKINNLPLKIGMSNILRIFAFLIPFLLIFFLLIYSIITNNVLKGIILLSGLLIIMFISEILKNLLKVEKRNNSICNFFPTPFSSLFNNNNYISPSTSSTLLSFCIVYLLTPMVRKFTLLSPPLFVNGYILSIFLFIIFLINVCVEYFEGCATISSIFMGIFSGGFFGYIYYFLIDSKDKSNLNLAYFLKLNSTKEFCNVPSEEKYKCRIKRIIK